MYLVRGFVSFPSPWASASVGALSVFEASNARAVASEIRKLRAEGVGATDISRRLGIGRASVYRALKLG